MNNYCSIVQGLVRESLQAKGIEPFLPEYEPSVLPLTLYLRFFLLSFRAGVEPTTFWLTAKRSSH